MDFDKFVFDINLTEQEARALAFYKGEPSVSINCIMNDGWDVEYSYSKVTGSPHPFATIGIEHPIETIDLICSLYSAIYKISKLRDDPQKEISVLRGTTSDEIRRLREAGITHKFLSTTYSQTVGNRFALAWNRDAALMHLTVSGEVPFLKYTALNDTPGITERKISDLDESEILLAPFCSVEFQDDRTHGEARPRMVCC